MIYNYNFIYLYDIHIIYNILGDLYILGGLHILEDLYILGGLHILEDLYILGGLHILDDLYIFWVVFIY